MNELSVPTVDISKALAIDGWMNDYALYWLAEQASKHYLIAEVGSYLGRSTRVLGDYTPGMVAAIDTWNGPVGIGAPVIPNFREKFEENLADLIAAEKVIPYDAKQVLLFRGLDMVFIDANHEYEYVKNDILNWKQWIAPGGLLCGHDASHPDVKKAVNETLPGAGSIVEADIWCINV